MASTQLMNFFKITDKFTQVSQDFTAEVKEVNKTINSIFFNAQKSKDAIYNCLTNLQKKLATTLNKLQEDLNVGLLGPREYAFVETQKIIIGITDIFTPQLQQYEDKKAQREFVKGYATGVFSEAHDIISNCQGKTTKFYHKSIDEVSTPTK